MITVGTTDRRGVGRPMARMPIKVAASDLFADSGATVKGKTFVETARSKVEGQLQLLNSFIALDDVDPDAAGPGRQHRQGEGVWDANPDGLSRRSSAPKLPTSTTTRTAARIGDQRSRGADQLDSTRVNTSGLQGIPTRTSSNYPVTRDSKPDDQDAMNEIDDILEALSSLDDFEDATDDGRPLRWRRG